MNTIRREQAVGVGQNSASGGYGRPCRARWVLGMMVLTALATLVPAKASRAQTDAVETVHEITWVHSSPAEVSSFVVFVSPEPAPVAVTRQINVGKPGGGGDADLAQIFSALVPMSINDFIAVAAIGQNGLRSILSTWRQSQPSRPGQPLVVEP